MLMHLEPLDATVGARPPPISNLGRDGQVHTDPDDDVVKSLRGNEGWHHDSTYMPVQAKGAVFSADIVPPAGAPTGWADMRAAFDELDEAIRDLIADQVAYHSLYYSQGRSGYLPSRRNESGGYAQYGYHDLEPSLRPARQDPPRHRTAEPAHGTPRVRHRRDGPGRLGGAPRPHMSQPRRMWHTRIAD